MWLGRNFIALWECRTPIPPNVGLSLPHVGAQRGGGSTQQCGVIWPICYFEVGSLCYGQVSFRVSNDDCFGRISLC